MNKLFYPLLLAATIYFCSSDTEKDFFIMPGFDKIAHFFIFGLLATLLYRISFFSQKEAAGALLAILIVSIYGLLDEFHQSFYPQAHTVEFLDWLADTLGALTAILVYKKWSLYHTLLERPLPIFNLSSE